MSRAQSTVVMIAADGPEAVLREAEGDRSLLLLARDGDEDACRVLFDRHGRRLLDVLSSTGKDRGLAEDAAQEAFLRALTQADQLRESASFFPWLVRIALRVRIDLARKTQRERPTDELIDAASDEDPEARALASEDAARVQAALAELKAETRELLVLRYFANLSAAELAEVFGKSEVAIRKELQRARAAVKKRLGDWFEGRAP